MKTKSFKKVLALALATAMALTACGQKPVSNTSETEKSSETTAATETTEASDAATETVIDKDSLPVLTLYPKDANLFSGLVTGHRSDYFAENGFQLEVWTFSAEKTNAMLTSGDLPDMMYVAYNSDTLETLIDTDKIINYDDYKEYLPNFFGETAAPELAQYMDANVETIREDYSAGTGGLYILPFGLGTSTGMYSLSDTFDRNVVKLKWDVYEAIGAPEITDMWQLLDVAEEMLAYQPTAEDGTKMYGTFLDNGMDTDRFGGMYLWYQWHAYHNSAHAHFVEVSYVTGEASSIFADDSLYKEGAKWYNEMYRRGLMDPDSISTARTDQAPKLDNGLAMLPSGTLPGWATKYYPVFVPGLTVYRDFTSNAIAGKGTAIVINKETDHLEECLAFVNLLADPYSWLRINYGPEGDIWEADGNVLSITDKFAAWLEEKGAINFFPMSDGTEWSTWNTQVAVSTGTPIPGYVNVNGGALPSVPTSWPDAGAITEKNDNWAAWKETMGAESLWDYCEQNDVEVCMDSPLDGLVLPNPDESQLLTIATIKDVVVPATWNMIYAETDEEFEQLWDQMVEDAMALGAQDIVDWKIQSYADAIAANKAK